MEECGILIHKLNSILDNLKKNPNTKYKLATLKKKLHDSKAIYNEIIKNIEIIDNKEKIFLFKATKDTFGEIKTLLDYKLNFPKLISLKTISLIILNLVKLYKKHKMTSHIEIIKTIPLLVPQFSGEGEKLNSIIAALNACKTLITDANRAVAIQVILSRLDGKARSAVGDNPLTIDEVIQNLNNKCRVKIAPETVVAKLNATKQNGEIGKFTEQIEKLTLELERAYISENVPLETASRMAVKAGVKALANGVKNNESKLLLKAGQFSTVSLAVEKLTENEPANNGSNSVFHYRSQNPRNYNYNYTRYANNNPRNRGNGNRQNNHGRNERYQRQYQNSNSNYRGNHSNNSNRYHRNEQRGSGSRVYVAHSGNLPAPQQIIVGGQRQSPDQEQNQEQPNRPQQQVRGQAMHYVQRHQ